MWGRSSDKNTATVSSKGQVTIPKHLREHLGVSAGDEVLFVRGEGRRLTILPRNVKIEDLFGSIKSPYDRPSTLEEWKEAAIQGWVYGEPDESEWEVEETAATTRTA